jgi:hypothetical protein
MLHYAQRKEDGKTYAEEDKIHAKGLYCNEYRKPFPSILLGTILVMSTISLFFLVNNSPPSHDANGVKRLWH